MLLILLCSDRGNRTNEGGVAPRCVSEAASADDFTFEEGDASAAIVQHHLGRLTFEDEDGPKFSWFEDAERQ